MHIQYIPNSINDNKLTKKNQQYIMYLSVLLPVEIANKQREHQVAYYELLH